MIIDIHNHTSKYSVCSHISINELINRYINAGMDGICITEHDFLWPKKEQSKLIKEYDDKIKIFFGVESNTDIGHILIFGIKEYDLDQYVKFEELLKVINRETTALIWAHPFRWGIPKDIIIDEDLINHFDAIELYNGNVTNNIITETKNFFDEYHVKYVGGSDTHTSNMALKYATRFYSKINSIEELVDRIKNQNYYPIKL